MALSQAQLSDEPIVQNGKQFFPIQLASLRLDSVPFFSLYFRPSVDCSPSCSTARRTWSSAWKPWTV